MHGFVELGDRDLSRLGQRTRQQTIVTADASEQLLLDVAHELLVIGSHVASSKRNRVSEPSKIMSPSLSAIGLAPTGEPPTNALERPLGARSSKPRGCAKISSSTGCNVPITRSQPG